MLHNSESSQEFECYIAEVDEIEIGGVIEIIQLTPDQGGVIGVIQLTPDQLNRLEVFRQTYLKWGIDEGSADMAAKTLIQDEIFGVERRIPVQQSNMDLVNQYINSHPL